MLYDAVHTGDKLILEYVEDGKYNEVLGARTGDTTLRTVAAYNEYMRSQRVLDVITFSVVEIFWLAGAVLFWLLHRKELRTVLTRKRKRKKACESHNQLSNIS